MKTLLLLGACVLSISLGFGRGASSETFSRRSSSQQQDLLANLAAIKAATAKIEESLAIDEAERSTVNSSSGDSRSGSPIQVTEQRISINQEDMNRLVNDIYQIALAKLKALQTDDVSKIGMGEAVRLGKQSQIMLNPSQAIADALAPQILLISNSFDVKQFRKMILDAALGSRHLIEEYNRYVQSKDYRSKVYRLKQMQLALDAKVQEKLRDIVYDKKRSDESSDGSYYISSHGRMLINNFANEYVKLGLMRKNGITKDKSLMRLDSNRPIIPGSVERQIVTDTIETLFGLGTSQLDLTHSGIVIDYMMLLKAGINFPSLSHKYYTVVGKKLFKTEHQDGSYVVNKDAKVDYDMAEEELIALKGIVQGVLTKALEQSKLKAHMFLPIRLMLSAKLELPANDSSENLEDGST